MNRKFEPIREETFLRKKDGSGCVEVFFEEEKLLFARLNIEPGCSLNRDIHPAGEEGYYVLTGELTVTLPEENVVRKIQTGEVFFVPQGVYHIASNTGTMPVSVIAAIGGRA